MLCVAYGDSMPCSDKRRKLGKEYRGDKLLREEVVAAWKQLMEAEQTAQGQTLEQVFPGSSPGKVCLRCFNAYKKFCDLRSNVRNYLAAADLANSPSSTPTHRGRE